MSPPAWLDPLFDAEGMRATDRWAIEERGIPSLDLMERAGEGLAAVIARQARGGRIAIVCGKGNNGGDGLVAARLLRAAGRDVDVLAVWPPESLRGDAAEQLRRLPGAPPEPFDARRLEGASVVVDALLGTGSTGAPRDEAAAAIEAMTAAGGPVVAADVPSGVDASTGEVAGPAVRAAATATFHAAKVGLWVDRGKAHAGEVSVIDIGIPPGAPAAPAAGLLTAAVLDEVPRREPGSTKFSSGTVVVLGGSAGLTGAPTMSAMAAMRAGAGYVTVAAPASLELAFSVRLLEAMTARLPEDDGALTPAAVEPALERLERAGAAVLGPGLGRAEGAAAFAQEMTARIETPLVVDADGLNALAAGFPGDLPRRGAPTVLTPHAGELGRLLGVESAEIGRHRLAHARDAAERAGAIVVLKGDDTLIVEPGGRVAISPGGAPALATAGTGDVLSGVTAAMLAKALDPFTATCAAVFLHLRAGQLAAEPHGPDAVIASDVVAALPAALTA
ncbi:MAG TPA: NAD(P)H-hydrate dehydratase [Solirubrobacteraceae bacterium]|nr:NAD(P)H-hydrate dehydratase [Solirubrobacteraceae bacterium]